jgi:hypothetical protein
MEPGPGPAGQSDRGDETDTQGCIIANGQLIQR